MDLADLMESLAEPFDARRIAWKPQAVSGNRALAIAYADARTYQDRLNDVARAEWSDGYEVLGNGAVVLCRLTICGVTRADIGEAPKDDQNTATSALVQAFKRACVKFRVGRYLYDLPKKWVDYNPQRKCFTDKALRELRANLAVVSRRGAEQDESPRCSRESKPPGENAGDGVHQVEAEEASPEGVERTGRGPGAEGKRCTDSSASGTNGQKRKTTATDFWTLYNKHKSRVSREDAQQWAATGDWEYALAQLQARA